jgi:hypothetical protein
MAIQGIIDRLTEVGRCYLMERTVEKFQIMRNSRQPSYIQIIHNPKHLENVEYFNHLGNLITGDVSGEIKSRIAIVKAAFNIKKTLFTSQMDLNLTHKPVTCYNWSIALCGAKI